ncbi:MAG: hypothetical protein V2A34_13160 [Lentisphaerota bacterium]
MPTKVEKKVVAADEAAQPAPIVSPFAILLELDNVLLNERQVRFDVLKGMIAAQKAELTIPMFSRYCLNGSLASGLEGLFSSLGLKKMDAVQTAEALKEKVAEALLSAKKSLNPSFEKFLQQVVDSNVAAAAVSMLAQDKAEALFNQLDLGRWNTKLFVYNEPDKIAPKADTWLKTAKALGKQPRRCAAFVSSMSSCKAALSVDMYCMALPDAFSIFQDFSGVNVLLESMNDLDSKAFLKAIRLESRK